MIFSENTAYLDGTHDGDSVVLVSNVGGRKDRRFSRNYAFAKHAADRGRLKQVIVQVVANGETYRTVEAFRRAVGRPHPAVRAVVVGDGGDVAAVAGQVASIVPAPEPPRERRRSVALVPPAAVAPVVNDSIEREQGQETYELES